MTDGRPNAPTGTTTAPTTSTVAPAAPRYRPHGPASRAIGGVIFFSRWLQAPLYVGLIVAQLIYVVVFWIELYHLGESVVHSAIESVQKGESISIEESTVMLGVLGLIDVVMVANLLIMVIIGGYETFVSRIDIDGHPDQPEWLSHVNANVLKVKLAMAIIGISSIHLLRTFIEVNDLGANHASTVTGQTYTWQGVFWQVMIHLTFILSAVALALIDRWSLRHSIPRAAEEQRAYPDEVAERIG